MILKNPLKKCRFNFGQGYFKQNLATIFIMEENPRFKNDKNTLVKIELA